MNTSVKHFLRRSVSKEECRDAGMAVVLLLLILDVFSDGNTFGLIAMAVLVVNMVVPQALKFIAILWFGFAHLLGTITSSILLAVVFFGLVTPVGLLRRLLRRDPMQLRAYRAGDTSVMSERNHTFAAADIEKPY